jgi:hypothetical protein
MNRGSPPPTVAIGDLPKDSSILSVAKNDSKTAWRIGRLDRACPDLAITAGRSAQSIKITAARDDRRFASPKQVCGAEAPNPSVLAMSSPFRNL